MPPTTTIVIVAIVVGIVLLPMLIRQRNSGYNGRDPRMQSYGNRSPYVASTSQPPSPLLFSLLLLFMLGVIGIVILGILAPNILHALLHLFF